MKSTQDIHTIDAKGQTPGRLATQIVQLLMGKHKATFENHIDGGDFVQVLNAAKMEIHPKKLIQKVYHHHTTYASGLRTKKMSTLFAQNPGEIILKAVSRMLPKNKHRSKRLARLEVKN